MHRNELSCLVATPLCFLPPEFCNTLKKNMCSACRQIQFTHKRPDEKLHWLLLFLYFSNRTAWRKAIVACKLAIDNMEKDELLRGGENQSTRQRWVLFYWSSAGELRWWLNRLNTIVKWICQVFSFCSAKILTQTKYPPRETFQCCLH